MRVLVIVQVTVSPESTVTSTLGPFAAAPSSQATEDRYFARSPVSETVYVPGATAFSPAPPSPTPAATTSSPTLRSNVPPSVAGRSCLTTLIVPGLRVLVNVQTVVVSAVTLTPKAEVVPVVPSVQDSEEPYWPSFAPASATLWEPIGTVTVAFAPLPPETTVVPSTLRSNVPGSFAGMRFLTTFSWPVLRVLVNVQVTVSPESILTADGLEPSLHSDLVSV